MLSTLWLISATLLASTVATPIARGSRIRDIGIGTGNHTANTRIIQQPSCTTKQFQRFALDYSFGIGYVRRVKEIIGTGNNAWRQFFGRSYDTEEQATDFKDDFLKAFASLSNNPDRLLAIEYGDGTSSECTNPTNLTEGTPSSYIVNAHATVEPAVFYLCAAYFRLPADQSQNDQWCSENPLRMSDEFETGASILMHEYTHLLTDLLDSPFRDRRYGSFECNKLSSDDEDSAAVNPDNFMFLTLKTYWEGKCQKEIAISPAPEG